jgi:hypothetical protein
MPCLLQLSSFYFSCMNSVEKVVSLDAGIMANILVISV